MPPLNETQLTGQAYWRSLDQLADTPEFRAFLHREFPAGASELVDSADRRHFLKIMGASLALAGLGMAGCRRWPEEEIVPFASRPADRTPGIPVQYATSMELGGVAMGLLATAYDGRPIKIEGNPDHPMSRGATDVFAQASVLDLYDPDRSRDVKRGGESSDWASFIRWTERHMPSLRSGGGAGLRVLCETTSSPSMQSMRQRMVAAFPGMQWHEYEPVNDDNERAGTMLAFSAPFRSQFAFDQADVIVSLDADFLGAHPAAVKHGRDFASTRRAADAKKSMSRLYVFEAALSLTGANADERLALRSADVAVVAARLAARLAPDTSAVAADLASTEVSSDGRLDAMLDHVVHDLQAHDGRALVVAGAHQPPEVHVLVHLINDAIGAVGQTVRYAPLSSRPSHVDSLRQLITALDSGSVDTLLIIGGNPAYDAPADLQFGDAIARAAHSIHLSDFENETAQRCEWRLPRAHYLETWGDGRAYDGTLSIQQPLIEPLFGSYSPVEVLAVLCDDEVRRGEQIVRRTFGELTGLTDSDSLWRRTLHDGLLPGSDYSTERPRLRRAAVAAACSALAASRAAVDLAAMQLLIIPDSKVHDGRFANNGWLQELPDPLTKLTWDNAVQLGVARAAELNVASGDMVRLTASGATIDAPVLVMPGLADDVAVVTLGYGRELINPDGAPARVCTGAGFNANVLRTSAASSVVEGLSMQRIPGSYPLAVTQDHHAIDVEGVGGREQQRRVPSLFREADLDEYRHHPEFASHRTHITHRLSLWDENLAHHRPAMDVLTLLDGRALIGKVLWEQKNDEGRLIALTFEWTDDATAEVVRDRFAADQFVRLERDVLIKHQDYAWGMSIDLSACTGCSACVVACQAENNIPIVGKDQVLRGREMHWIRLDRYYKFGTNENGALDANRLEGVALQPVACHHCENAPCEQVCPVAATAHDADGLNVMVYNRCIGTRYCSNNCPYKVRRFNYFDYHRRAPEREQPGTLLQVEPDYYLKQQSSGPELQRMQFNPEVSVRMRGVMEKCTFCVQRIAEAKIEAKNAWVRTDPDQRPDSPRDMLADGRIRTACQQVCPAEAISFGNLNDATSVVTREQNSDRSYEMLEELNVKARLKYKAKLRNPVTSGATAEHAGHEAAEDTNH